MPNIPAILAKTKISASPILSSFSSYFLKFIKKDDINFIKKTNPANIKNLRKKLSSKRENKDKSVTKAYKKDKRTRKNNKNSGTALSLRSSKERQ